jgi:hypothetical protein
MTDQEIEDICGVSQSLTVLFFAQPFNSEPQGFASSSQNHAPASNSEAVDPRNPSD